MCAFLENVPEKTNFVFLAFAIVDLFFFRDPKMDAKGIPGMPSMFPNQVFWRSGALCASDGFTSMKHHFGSPDLPFKPRRVLAKGAQKGGENVFAKRPENVPLRDALWGSGEGWRGPKSAPK